jgi:hypothetical protein
VQAEDDGVRRRVRAVRRRLPPPLRGRRGLRRG